MVSRTRGLVKAWRRSAAASLVAASIAFAQAASAEITATDKQAVLSLYNDGKALLEAGKTRDACSRFEDAKRIDPTAMNLLLRLADCYQRLGRTASAWSEYAEAAAIARSAGDRRSEDAEKRAAELAPRLPRLALEVPAASRAPGLEVRRDGVLVPEARWGSAEPIDPGTHTIEVSAPGRIPARLTAQVSAEGATARLTVDPLAALPSAAQTPGDAALPGPRPGKTQRTAALVAGGAGLVGAAIGAVLGLRAKSLRDESNDGHCDAQSYCDDEGIGLRDDAQAAGTGSTIAFAAGAGAIAAGVALWLTAPSGEAPREPRPVGVLLPGGALIGARGTF